MLGRLKSLVDLGSRTVDVIWQTRPGAQTEFEFEFIDKVALSQVRHRTHFDDSRLALLREDSVVVYSSDAPHAPDGLLRYLDQLGEFALIHLSNEQLFANRAVYDRARVVLRSYYDPRETARHVHALPLGFKSGFLNPAGRANSEERGLAWCFVGQLKNRRREMATALSPLAPNTVQFTQRFDDPDGLDVHRLRALYGRSVFAPCPFGWINPDTFRIMEALECGAIPVCVKLSGVDYYRYVYGDHPLVVGDDWIDAARQMLDLMRDKGRLSDRQRRVWDWYGRFKSDLASDVSRILGRGRGEKPLRSPQFAHQRQGRADESLRQLFDAHFGPRD